MQKAFFKIAAAGLLWLSIGPDTLKAAIVYQLPVRSYLASGSTKATAGRLEDLTPEVLAAIRHLGVDYLWLTGIVEHASPDNTDPDGVKGNAGSYYAIHDAWDVDPLLGTRADFHEAVTRAHHAGLKVMIDLIPNHTARTHRTDVLGRSDFGDSDRSDVFFDPANHYFYMPGETFVPPPAKSNSGADGVFDTDPARAGNQYENPARVTGNNIRSAHPSHHDWYETAKLNYGFNFMTGHGHYNPRPRTWDMMVNIAKHWMEMGVDGFRIDFAHSVPLEFWRYFSSALRKDNKNIFLLAEVYENDHGMRVPGFSYQAILDSGIDSVYQSELYWGVHSQAGGSNEAQRLSPKNLPLSRPEILAQHRAFTSYVENHDEVRVASKHFVRGLKSSDSRATYGLAMAAYAALLPGNFLIHGGQELGENAENHGPFAGDNGKTSIFDFVFQPLVRSWLDQTGSDFQKQLRKHYTELFSIKKFDAFTAPHNQTKKSLIDLSGPNKHKPESQWIASYVRYDSETRRAFLVITNSDPYHAHEATVHFTETEGHDSTGALNAMGISRDSERHYGFTDIWTRKGWSPSDPALGSRRGIPGDVLYRPSNVPSGLYLGHVPAGTTLVLKVEAEPS